jgi:hypothetical protein
MVFEFDFLKIAAQLITLLSILFLFMVGYKNAFFCRLCGIQRAKVLRGLCLVPMITGTVWVFSLTPLIMTTNTTIPLSWQ